VESVGHVRLEAVNDAGKRRPVLRSEGPAGGHQTTSEAIKIV